MSDNVVKFPLNEERALRQQRWFALGRVAAIRAKIASRPMLRVSDQATVASNMWRILEQLETGSPSIPKRRVLQAAGQGGENDSTKRLPRFALHPKFQGAEKEKRLKGLAKKIQAYVKIIEAAAILSGGDADALLEALVEGTTYDIVPSEHASDLSDDLVRPWDDVEIAVAKIAEGLAAKYELIRFFEEVEKYEIADKWGIKSHPGRRAAYIANRTSTLPALVRWEDMPPCPVVYLGKVRAFDDIPCTVCLQPGSGWGDLEDEFRSRICQAGLETVWLTCVARPFTRCWLKLAPYGEPMSIRPLLFFQSEAEIIARQTFDGFDAFGGGTCKPGDVLAIVRGALEEGANDAHEETNAAIVALASDEETDTFVNPEWTAFFEMKHLSAYSLSDHARSAEGHSFVVPFDHHARAYLAKPMAGTGIDADYCHATSAAIRQEGGQIKSHHLTVLGSSTMAAALERSLFLVTPDVRIDRFLDNSARDLVDRLRNALAHAEAAYQNGLAAILRDYS